MELKDGKILVLSVEVRFWSGRPLRVSQKLLFTYEKVNLCTSRADLILIDRDQLGWINWLLSTQIVPTTGNEISTSVILSQKWRSSGQA